LGEKDEEKDGSANHQGNMEPFLGVETCQTIEEAVEHKEAKE
jgi:hypothetical protein